MTHIIDVALNSDRDKGPLQMVSGEQVDYWRRVEMAARVAASNRGGTTGEARKALDALYDAIRGVTP